MKVNYLELPVEPELEARLRRTLSQVAATIDDPGTPLVVAPSREVRALADQRRARRWRRRATAIGLALVAAPVAAFAYGQLGPEFVDQLPPRHVLLEGTAGAHRYWLVPAFHTDACGPRPGVELVSEPENRIGEYWNTLGVLYGEITPPWDYPSVSATGSPLIGRSVPRVDPTHDCMRPDERAWLDDPSLASLGTTRLDPHGDWVLLAAVHPDVRMLRITTPGGPARSVATVPRPDHLNGPRYAAATLPADATQADVTLLDEHGRPIPGGLTSLPLRS